MILLEIKDCRIGVFSLAMASVLVASGCYSALPKLYEYEFEGPSIERVVDNVDDYNITLDETTGEKEYTVSKKELAKMLEWDGTISDIGISETEKISATTTKGLEPLVRNVRYMCGGIVVLFGNYFTLKGLRGTSSNFYYRRRS